MDSVHSYQRYKEKSKLGETALISEFNDRNPMAFRYIFESYYSGLVLFGQGMLKQQQQEAEDVAQDAFIKLWNQSENFSHLPAIKSFLYTTVKNACLDKLRREQTAGKYQLHAERKQQEQEADFIEPLITAETTRLINEAIEALPEQGRNVFKMSLSGLKNDEIAERLNISVNTVKTHKQRALASLRVSLGEAMLILILLHHDHLIK